VVRGLERGDVLKERRTDVLEARRRGKLRVDRAGVDRGSGPKPLEGQCDTFAATELPELVVDDCETNRRS